MICQLFRKCFAVVRNGYTDFFFFFFFVCVLCIGQVVVLGKSEIVFPKLTNVTILMNSNSQRKYPAKH